MVGDRFFHVPSDNSALAHIKNSDKNNLYKYELVYRGKRSFTDGFSMEFINNKSVANECKLL